VNVTITDKFGNTLNTSKRVGIYRMTDDELPVLVTYSFERTGDEKYNPLIAGGIIKNIASYDVKSVIGEITLFDASNNIIQNVQFNTFKDVLKPNETTSFYLDYDWSSYYDHYEIKIISAEMTDTESKCEQYEYILNDVEVEWGGDWLGYYTFSANLTNVGSNIINGMKIGVDVYNLKGEFISFGYVPEEKIYSGETREIDRWLKLPVKHDSSCFNVSFYYELEITCE